MWQSSQLLFINTVVIATKTQTLTKNIHQTKTEPQPTQARDRKKHKPCFFVVVLYKFFFFFLGNHQTTAERRPNRYFYTDTKPFSRRPSPKRKMQQNVNVSHFKKKKKKETRKKQRNCREAEKARRFSIHSHGTSRPRARSWSGWGAAGQADTTRAPATHARGDLEAPGGRAVCCNPRTRDNQRYNLPQTCRPSSRCCTT